MLNSTFRNNEDESFSSTLLQQGLATVSPESIASAAEHGYVDGFTLLCKFFSNLQRLYNRHATLFFYTAAMTVLCYDYGELDRIHLNWFPCAEED